MGKKTFEPPSSVVWLLNQHLVLHQKVPPGRPSQENANAHATDEVAEIVPVTRKGELTRESP
jgi:hypothetical protein